MAGSRAAWYTGSAIALACIAVSAALAQTPPPLPAVFSAAQAARGREVYADECASCHGARMNDGTAISVVGPAFLQQWSHPLITLDDLFYVVQTTMPKNKGNSLPAADYVAVTKYYLANTEQAKRDLHKSGFVRTPLELYLKNADWKRDPNARVDVESLKKLSVFMLEKLHWLEKPVNVDSMVDLSYLPR